MTRRIVSTGRLTKIEASNVYQVRTVTQLGAVALCIAIFVLLLDNSGFRVLPSGIHTYMPSHHPGSVVIDITVKTCSRLNPLTGCKLDAEKWHRIDKDLYLGSGWVSRAYLHIARKKEEELGPEDRVVVDVSVGLIDPTLGVKGEADEQWESRSGGIWLKRSSKVHDSDSQKAVTAVDVLFGADAVDPRDGWEIKDTALLLNSGGEVQEARLSIKRGPSYPVKKPQPRVKDNGKFKIMQVSDLHLSTGFGKCRDAVPEGHNGGRCDADLRTLEFIGKLLDNEKPDLVVLSGDQVNGDTAPDVESVS